MSVAASACGSASSSTFPSAQEVKVYLQQRADVFELVACAQRHGIRLPKPLANNGVNLAGVDLRGHRRAEFDACYKSALERGRRQARADGTTPAQTPKVVAFEQERERLIEVVSCARRRGVHLAEPDADNKLDVHDVRGARDRSTIESCLSRIVNKAESNEAE